MAEEYPVYEEDLEEYDEEYQSSEPPAGEGEPMPDGTYQCVVDAVKLVRFKEWIIFKWDLKVISGPFEGRMVWKSSFIQQGRLGFLKGELETCGIIIDKISELAQERILSKFLDIKLEIKQKTSEKTNDAGKHYVNIYIQKRLEINENSKDDFTSESNKESSPLFDISRESDDIPF